MTPSPRCLRHRLRHVPQISFPTPPNLTLRRPRHSAHGPKNSFRHPRRSRSRPHHFHDRPGHKIHRPHQPNPPFLHGPRNRRVSRRGVPLPYPPPASLRPDIPPPSLQSRHLQLSPRRLRHRTRRPRLHRLRRRFHPRRRTKHPPPQRFTGLCPRLHLHRTLQRLPGLHGSARFAGLHHLSESRNCFHGRSPRRQRPLALPRLRRHAPRFQHRLRPRRTRRRLTSALQHGPRRRPPKKNLRPHQPHKRQSHLQRLDRRRPRLHRRTHDSVGTRRRNRHLRRANRLHGSQPRLPPAFLLRPGQCRQAPLLYRYLRPRFWFCFLLRTLVQPAELDQMGRHHLAGGRNSLRRLQNERLHSPPQTLRLQRNLTPAFVEAADRGGLFFSSLLFSSLLCALCVSAFSALNSLPIFYFQISFFYSIPYFFSSIATRTRHRHPISSAACSKPIVIR